MQDPDFSRRTLLASAGLFVQTDVTSEEQVRALVATVETRHGRLDHAFNNVGTGSRARRCTNSPPPTSTWS